MNGRKLFREYAQSRGKEAIGFIEIKEEVEYYGDYINTVLITQDSKGNLERTIFEYEDLVHWIIKTKKLQ